MADEEVRVRPAERADAGAVRALLEELSELQREWRVFSPRPGFLGEVLDGIRVQVLNGEAVHLVAERRGTVVGTAFAREHVASRFSEARSMEVSGVVVSPAWRGRGIARRLLRALAEEALRRGIEHLDLATFARNEGALRFWRRVGFESRYVQLVGPVAGVLARLDGLDAAQPAPRPGAAGG